MITTEDNIAMLNLIKTKPTDLQVASRYNISCSFDDVLISSRPGISFKLPIEDLYIMFATRITKDDVGLSEVDNTSDLDKPVSDATETALGLKAHVDDLDETRDELEAHRVAQDNPHVVTKAQVGLSNVDNTSDINKPISNSVAIVVGLKAEESDLINLANMHNVHTGSVTNPHSVTKAQVGLGNVENVSQADAGISTATQEALDGKVDDSQLVIASSFDPETASLNKFPSEKAVADALSSTGGALSTHTADMDNPHGVDADDIGLGNVDNTADADKPISADTVSALDEKIDSDSVVTTISSNPNTASETDPVSEKAVASAIDAVNDSFDSHITDNNPHSITASTVGLGNVDNTSDAAKPVSQDTISALNAKADLVNGKIPVSQIPASVDDIEEFATSNAFPDPGESNKLFVALDTNQVYRWSGSAYTEISASLAIGLTAGTAFDGAAGALVQQTINSLQGAAEVKANKTNVIGDDATASISKYPSEKAVRAAITASEDAVSADVVVVPFRVNFPTVGLVGKLYIATDKNKTYVWDANLEEYIMVADVQKGLDANGITNDLDAPGVYTIDCSIDNTITLPQATGTQDRYILNFVNTIGNSKGVVTTVSPDLLNGIGGATFTTGGDETVMFVDAADGDWTYLADWGRLVQDLWNNQPTKASVGLANVDNTADADKPLSDADIAALALKADKSALNVTDANVSTHTNRVDNPHAVTKAQVGLSNVENVSQADANISDAAQSALNLKADKTTVTALALSVNTHHLRQDNPHVVTQTQVGLPNANNTSDADKPISTATQSALDGKATNLAMNVINSAMQTHLNASSNPHGVTQLQVGLGNVDNTSDAAKPISQDTIDALVLKADLVAGKIPSTQLPSYVDDVIHADISANFPVAGESGKIYIATTTNITYRWSGVGYTEISSSLAIGTITGTAADGGILDALVASTGTHSGRTDNPHAVTKSQVGLGNVNNTSDADKPVSDLVITALSNKSDLVSGVVPLGQLPTGVKNVVEVLNQAALPPTGEVGKVYVTKDTEKLYRWDGAVYKRLGGEHLELGTITGTAADGGVVAAINSASVNHGARTDNPHAVTKGQVGLGNVNNTTDIAKPISTLTQSALDLKATASALGSLTTSVNNHAGRVDNPHSVTKGQVGLGSVNNTSDAAKPVSTAVTNALGFKADLVSGKIPAGQLPGFVDDVIEVLNYAALPGTGETGKIYITLDDNKTFRWSGSAYAGVGNDLVIGTTTGTAADGGVVAAISAAGSGHGARTDNPHGVTKGQVGLSAVNNTSDAAKPISIQVGNALVLKATVTSVTAANSNTDNHKARTDNPHSVDKSDVGLGNVNNTSDAAKPVSTAMTTALGLKATVASVTTANSNTNTHKARTDNPHSVDKSDVGLGNVNNTTDAAKPVSIATTTALGLKADLVSGKIPAVQLPGYVDDVVEAANFAALPGSGDAGKIYVTLDDNKTFRWTGSAYVGVGSGLEVGTTTGTAADGALVNGMDSKMPEEYATQAAFPGTGVVDKIYIDKATDGTFRWDTATTAYVSMGGGGGGAPATISKGVEIFASGTVQNSACLHYEVLNNTLDFVVGVAGSTLHCNINPTSAITFTIKKVVGGTESTIGTIAVNTSGVGTFTFTTAQALDSGDKIRINAPADPHGIADVFIRLHGVRAFPA